MTRATASLLAFVAALLTLACCGRPPSRSGPPSPATQAGDPRVTAVRGASWLHHLGLTVSGTSMGEMGGATPAGSSPRREPPLAEGGAAPGGLSSVMRRYMPMMRSDRRGAARLLTERFDLAGRDLYRLSCQSCHGPDGKGAPPEIPSLLGPVQGASPGLVRRRLAARGAEVDEALVGQLASQAAANLRQRLAKGGEKMPAFPHLQGDEVEALLGWLGELAAVPPEERTDLLVPESAARVGEHVVKGTCHICHDATGPGGGRMAMMGGIIPSLASFPAQSSLSTVVRQVQYGSSGMMGMMGGERMPAMPYLTEEEVAAAYLYLADYPPEP